MIMIKRLTDIALSTILLAASCAVGCALEDPCEPNETLSEDGKCIPIPTEPNDCGRSHYNCMTYGVKEARCDQKDNSPYYCLLVSCNNGFHRITNQDANTSAVMPEMCWQDSETECGESAEDCTKLEGALSVRCESGKCKVVTCRSDEYALMQDKCIKRNVRACGDDDGEKIDCISDWLPGIYHNNTSWINACVAGCADNACIVSSCRNLTDESDQSEIRFVKKSCSDVIDFAEAYKAAYLDLHHTAIELPDCMEDNAQPKTIDACIEDLCPDDDAKFMPELCGCGVPEDTGDDDGDGVINCKDACPRNATKATDVGAGGCGVKDSDHDGVDDSADVCPTRSSIKSAADLDTELLKQWHLLDVNGLPDVGRILMTEQSTRAKLCGIFVENEQDGMDGFHIYNAKDLDYLRVILREINQRETCSDSLDSCSYNMVRTKCIDGYKRTYQCKKCIENNEDNSILCTDASDNNVEPDELKHYLHISLENDINLDDLSLTLFFEDNTCISLWTPISFLSNMEFDGKGHTIAHTNNRSSDKYHRCSLSEALFEEIRFSDVHDLTIDFNMQGSGHAVFSNSITISDLSNIVIKSDYLETSAADFRGVGLVAGSIETRDGSTKTGISFDNREKIRIVAYNAENVGGIFGKGYNRKGEGGGYNTMKVTISSRIAIDSIEGKNDVGGLFGEGLFELSEGLDVQIDSVLGNSYIGGLIGDGDIYFQKTLNADIGSVSGNSYVGGLIGDGDLITDVSLVIRIDTVSGGWLVGGVIGRGSLQQRGAVSVKIDSVYGDMVVGGVIGQGELEQSGPLTTDIVRVSGEDDVGGIIGFSELYIQSGRLESSVILVQGEEHVGGLFGSLREYRPWHADGKQVGSICRVYMIVGRDYVGGLVGNGENLRVAADNSSNRAWIQNSVGYIYAKGEYVGGAFGYISMNVVNLDNYVGSIRGDKYVGGIAGVDACDDFLCGLETHHVKNVVKELVSDDDKTGGIFGDCLRNNIPCDLNGYMIYNEIDSMITSGGGGMFGRVGQFSGMEYIYNHINDVSVVTDTPFGGIAGSALVSSDSRELSFINHYVHISPRSIGSEKIQRFFGSVPLEGNHICRQFSISNISSYVDRLICSDNLDELAVYMNCALVLNKLSIAKSAFGVLGSSEQNSCYNVITSADMSSFHFSNSYWFSPDDVHYAPFGEGADLNAQGLTSFGNNTDQVNEIANTIKAWDEPAIESLELGGRMYDMPVVFTKEQFLEKTGMSNDENRYTEFDEWCRTVEQELLELQGSVE